MSTSEKQGRDATALRFVGTRSPSDTEKHGKRVAFYYTLPMRKGFSLVELSIVLVILGLLTGGILAGQSLIRAAELRSVTVDYSRYVTAVQSFRDKYFALPGDMTNATDFWGAMTNCGVASPSGTGTQTCNGNGNGQINNAGAASQTGEVFAFWKHLANAGMIEGTYTGIAGSGGFEHGVIGSNIMKSKLNNAGFYVAFMGTLTANAGYFDGEYNNTFFLGGQSGAGVPSGVIFSPDEAWNLDTKIDDGKPETGKMRPFKSDAGTGTTHCSNTTTKEYALTNTGKRCTLLFLQAF